MGNGPYKLTDWAFKVRLRLRASPQYWNREAVGPETVELRYFKQSYQQFLSYLTGEVDVHLGAALPFNADLLAAARKGQRADVHPVDAFGTYYFSFNCRPTLPDGRDNPLADVRVRKALALVVDKQQIVERVTRMHQPVADVFVPRGAIEGYESPSGLPSLSDAETPAEREAMIQRARDLLAEAGYEDPSQIPPIELIYNTGGQHASVVQALSAMWRDALGVRIRTEVQEWKVYLGRRQAGRFMIARSGWFGDYGDPTTFLDLFRTDNGNNTTGLADDKYDAMLDRAANMTDPEARLAQLAQAEAYLLNDRVPILPLFQYRMLHLYNPKRVQGVSHHPRTLQFYHQIKARRSRDAK